MTNISIFIIFFNLFFVTSAYSSGLYLKNDSSFHLEDVKVEIKILDKKPGWSDVNWMYYELKPGEYVSGNPNVPEHFFSKHVEVRLTAYAHLNDDLYKKIELYSQLKTASKLEGRYTDLGLVFFLAVVGSDHDNFQLQAETTSYGWNPTPR